MKNTYKALLSLAAGLLCSLQLNAIVAVKTPISYTQPDGSTITILLHGDEFDHYATTVSGERLYMHPDGFYRTTTPPAIMQSGPKRFTRESYEQSRQVVNKSVLSEGKHKFLLMLIEFSDLKFTVANPQQAFTDLINKPGYSDNGGTGSAYDFYLENSNGKFDPEFVVVGPITLSKSYSYYGGNDSGGNDKYPDLALYEACQIADPQVNFADFDQDHDGYVDNVFYYYAGHNEAEGASANTIWPHSWSLYNYNARFDGVRVYSYACTSEYSGSSGTRMCGIGTFCHEFGHVLGLPDFYDVDYNTNGYSDPLSDFSTMCSGSYNNNGRTPPYFSAMERYMLDWIDMPQTLKYTGDYSLSPIRNDVAYRIDSPNSGEYYLIESRDKYGWDKYINSGNFVGGLCVYHVDQSSNRVSGSTTAYQLWNNGSNMINAYSSHTCYYLVKAYSSSSENYWVFPGSRNVTTYSPKSWAGKTASVTLSNIKYSNGTVTFHVNGETGDLKNLGFSYITVSGGTPTVVCADGKTIKSTSWSNSGTSYKATVTYTDGTTEILEL